ncbi:MAG: ABC transporter permease, partial [Oscillospiraceae bacterium]|nr:ABC transporter permease [Oscillospiraceae bacterium]
MKFFNNVLNKVTFEALKKNRTRTVVTIIGVILSVSMITAVTTFASSMQDYMIRDAINNYGDWHICYQDAGLELLDTVKEHNEVKDAFVTKELGGVILKWGQFDITSTSVLAFSEGAFETLPVDIVKGRLPQNENEIIIPDTKHSGGWWNDLEIGEVYTLELLKGFDFNEYYNAYYYDEDGNPIDRSEVDLDDLDADLSEPDFVNDYTVVGTFVPRFFGNNFFSFLTKLPETPDTSDPSYTDEYNVYAVLKNPKDTYSFGEKTEKYAVVEYNYYLMRVLGISSNENLNDVLFGFAAVVIGLILLGSISLIYNAFSISVSERTKQFGILSSVGATKKQLRGSVLFEGFCIGIVGIPLGILAGIGGIAVALNVVGGIISDMTSSSNSTVLTLSVSWESVAVAMGISTVLILLSAYIPARRAMKVSAIESIRQTADIKINPKQVKSPKWLVKVLGVEGLMSDKNFKRNKKRYKATIGSLFMSVVLFVSAGSFGMYLHESAD